MKKILLIAVLAIISLGAYAQSYEKSLGLRLGRPVGLTYKQFVSSANAIEIIADLDIFEKHVFKLNGSGFFLWQSNLGEPGLDWFIGPGASAGLFFIDVEGDKATRFNVSANALIGLEYKFANAPIALSADFGPRFYFLDDVGFYWGGALTVRYTF
ncbi:MAG: hypothetical protein FWH23_07090 [Bacteroidales bacterium]|nr:hypothetical protein [Bacteroidales bacterium]